MRSKEYNILFPGIPQTETKEVQEHTETPSSFIYYEYFAISTSWNGENAIFECTSSAEKSVCRWISE